MDRYVGILIFRAHLHIERYSAAFSGICPCCSKRPVLFDLLRTIERGEIVWTCASPDTDRIVAKPSPIRPISGLPVIHPEQRSRRENLAISRPFVQNGRAPRDKRIDGEVTEKRTSPAHSSPLLVDRHIPNTHSAVSLEVLRSCRSKDDQHAKSPTVIQNPTDPVIAISRARADSSAVNDECGGSAVFPYC